MEPSSTPNIAAAYLNLLPADRFAGISEFASSVTASAAFADLLPPMPALDHFAAIMQKNDRLLEQMAPVQRIIEHAAAAVRVGAGVESPIPASTMAAIRGMNEAVLRDVNVAAIGRAAGWFDAMTASIDTSAFDAVHAWAARTLVDRELSEEDLVEELPEDVAEWVERATDELVAQSPGIGRQRARLVVSVVAWFATTGVLLGASVAVMEAIGTWWAVALGGAAGAAGISGRDGAQLAGRGFDWLVPDAEQETDDTGEPPTN